MSAANQPLRAAIIGCGRPGGKAAGATGSATCRNHAKGYADIGADIVRLVALADIVEANAHLLRDDLCAGKPRCYLDYRQMLREEKPDMVSICTWPHLHAEMVQACAEAGVRAVHTEKPLAVTWADSRRMVEACQRSGTQLTVNHQRRFGMPFRKARELVKEGAIGELLRIECACSNMYDWGTHWFDMMFLFNDETPAEWVLAQIELRGSHLVFGAPVEGQGISCVRFRNGVYATMLTGKLMPMEPQIRLLGSEGMIEIGYKTDLAAPNVLRVVGNGRAKWEEFMLPEGMHTQGYVTRALANAIECLSTGQEPELAARKALAATELIFATYESSRRGGRVDLPLQIDDNPLADRLARQSAEGAGGAK